MSLYLDTSILTDVEIVNEMWSEKVRKYWKFLTEGEDCIVCKRMGRKKRKRKESVRVTTMNCTSPLFGCNWIIVSSCPLIIPENRECLWHELGHFVTPDEKDPVIEEFSADRWAVTAALESGFIRVAEEVYKRCLISSVSRILPPIYRKAGKMVVNEFSANFDKNGNLISRNITKIEKQALI